jgi:hypothetical protein
MRGRGRWLALGLAVLAANAGCLGAVDGEEELDAGSTDDTDAQAESPALVAPAREERTTVGCSQGAGAWAALAAAWVCLSDDEETPAVR